MSIEQVEVVDTNQAQVLTEFSAAGFVHGNIDRFRIGIVGDDVVIIGHSPAGTWSGVMLFERANAAAVINLIDEVLDGRLNREARDYVFIAAGKDRVGVSAQMPREVMTMSFYNNRRAKIDDFEQDGWDITVAPDTILKMYVELKKLLEQGKF